MRIFVLIVTILNASLSFINAQQVIDQVAKDLGNHEFKEVYKGFDDYLAIKLKPKKLKKVWIGVENDLGDFDQFIFEKTHWSEGGEVQTGTIQFAKGIMALRISLNEHQQLTSIFILPVGYSPPEYASDGPFGRKEYIIKSGNFELPGELIVPLNCQRCPVVIFVHGSGPLSRDEVVGPNKVFYDLAMGLAAQGIATFRYDKRSFVYPDSFLGQFDIYDETVDDAVKAAELIKNDSSLDFGKIILLGHSLGAYAMPIIADSLSWLDGVILMAGPAGYLEDLILYQVRYLSGLDGDTSRAEHKLINSTEKTTYKIKTEDFSKDDPASEMLVYWPGTFWAEIAVYRPIETFANSTMPALILQGGKDYQVPVSEFDTWHDAIRQNMSFILYDSLNHLFILSAQDGPVDYWQPRNVDHQVIKDIAEWTDTL